MKMKVSGKNLALKFQFKQFILSQLHSWYKSTEIRQN